MEITSEDQLLITYFLPEGKVFKDEEKNKYVRKVAVMECCENSLIMKTYSGIRKQVVELHGGDKQFKSRLRKMRDEYEIRQAKKPNIKNTLGKLF